MVRENEMIGESDMVGENEMLGENIDLASGGHRRDDGAGEGGRPFVGIHFACCDVYARIYINRDASAYLGHCPRCARRVRLAIGPGGTDRRFFTAG